MEPDMTATSHFCTWEVGEVFPSAPYMLWEHVALAYPCMFACFQIQEELFGIYLELLWCSWNLDNPFALHDEVTLPSIWQWLTTETSS